MAKEVIKNASLLLHSLQLASNINMVEFNAEAETVDTTNLAGNGWRETVAGIRTTNLSCELMLENAADPEETLNALLEGETSVPFTVTKTYPPAAGDVAWFTQVVALQLMRKAVLAQLWSGSMTFGNQGHAVRGQVLEFLEALDTTQNGDDVELTGGVAAGERLWIAVHVLAAEGTSPTLDLVLESDGDDTFASATTRITVPQFTGVGSYIGYVAGPITDEFFRIAATVGGTDPELTYLVAIGIAPTA